MVRGVDDARADACAARCARRAQPDDDRVDVASDARAASTANGGTGTATTKWAERRKWMERERWRQDGQGEGGCGGVASGEGGDACCADVCGAGAYVDAVGGGDVAADELAPLVMALAQQHSCCVSEAGLAVVDAGSARLPDDSIKGQ